MSKTLAMFLSNLFFGKVAGVALVHYNTVRHLGGSAGF